MLEWAAVVNGNSLVVAHLNHVKTVMQVSFCWYTFACNNIAYHILFGDFKKRLLCINTIQYNTIQYNENISQVYDWASGAKVHTFPIDVGTVQSFTGRRKDTGMVKHDIQAESDSCSSTESILHADTS